MNRTLFNMMECVLNWFYGGVLGAELGFLREVCEAT